MDFGNLLRTCASSYCFNTAVWYHGHEQTYEELFERACRFANALSDLGASKGDRVAVLGPNGAETVEQIAGLALGGYVRASLYTHQTAEANGYLVGLVDARVLLVHSALVADIRRHVDASVRIVCWGGGTPEGTLDYEQALAGASPSDPHIPLAPGDPHVIRFSAGTTGRPKGIMHTVERWFAAMDEYRWVTPQIDERDRYLAAGPLTHAAVIFLWPMLQVGAQVVVMDGFEPERALRLIEARSITFTLMVPTMIHALVEHPTIAERELSSLRCLNYAAAPITETTLVKALDAFGPVLYQMYGQSEAAPATMLLAHQHRPQGSERERSWLRSVGRATPNTRLTVVDDDGVALPVGATGEIAVHSPGRMSCLWGDEEGTAARLLADGSVLTRDMGHLDEDGFLYLADRKEDMIISGGYNIWPAELENAIAAHPAVREVCVVGVPHEKWGETPKAIVVLAPDHELDPTELISFTREQVGAIKKITSVEIVEALPRSEVGKVVRRELRDPYWAGQARRIAGA